MGWACSSVSWLPSGWGAQQGDSLREKASPEPAPVRARRDLLRPPSGEEGEQSVVEGGEQPLLRTLRAFRWHRSLRTAPTEESEAPVFTTCCSAVRSETEQWPYRTATQLVGMLSMASPLRKTRGTLDFQLCPVAEGGVDAGLVVRLEGMVVLNADVKSTSAILA